MLRQRIPLRGASQSRHASHDRSWWHRFLRLSIRMKKRNLRVGGVVFDQEQSAWGRICGYAQRFQQTETETLVRCVHSGRESVIIDKSRRDGRVAEGGGLLNRYRGLNLYRGFESPSLRHIVDNYRLNLDAHPKGSEFPRKSADPDEQAGAETFPSLPDFSQYSLILCRQF